MPLYEKWWDAVRCVNSSLDLTCVH